MGKLLLFQAVMIVLIAALEACGSKGNTFSDCKEHVKVHSCRGKTRQRTLDGTCNNLHHFTWGAAFTPLARMARSTYRDVSLKSRRVPTPHEVVNKLFKILDENNGNKGLVSNLHMTFGQFLAHDMDLTPNAGGCKNPKCGNNSYNDFKYPCSPIKFSNNPKVPGCTKFIRSFAVCPRGWYGRRRREQVNVISSFIDASMVYSVSEQKLETLRTRDAFGTIKVTSNKLLPIDPNHADDCKDRGGCFLAGEVRANEHIGLASYHTLFVREHNRMAKKLKIINPRWGREKIFQTTRTILGAIIQHITYNEYVPTLATLRRYKGYRRGTNPSMINEFSTVAFRFGHSQVKNSWSQLNANFDQVRPNVPLRQTFFNNTLLFKHGIEPTMFGLVGNESEEVDLKFASGVGKKLFIPPHQRGFQSLMAINIQRGRDHNLPGYNEYRNKCGLQKARRFRDIAQEIKSRKVRGILQKLYGNVNNHIDLFAAGLAEDRVPGKLVGKTFGCIIRTQFERLREGDRFFYKRRGVFKRKQLREIEKVTMAKILCDNLKGVVSMQKNVFKAFKHDETRRCECSHMPGINLYAWKDGPTYYGDNGESGYENPYGESGNDENDNMENDENSVLQNDDDGNAGYTDHDDVESDDSDIKNDSSENLDINN